MGKNSNQIGDIDQYVEGGMPINPEDEKKIRRKKIWRIFMIILLIAQVTAIIILET
jgi:hypothetical protein